MADCRFKLKELMNSLTAKEQILAQFILDFPSDVIQMSINELAQACGTSISTVVRLCKSAGYNGYKAFCRELSVDLDRSQTMASDDYTDIRPGDSIESIMNTVCANDIRAIENTLSVLKIDELEKAVAAIAAAKRVDFYGVAVSGNVAMDACNKFVRINKISMSAADPHQQILNASLLKPEDAAVLISYSGNTKDILETADVVKQSGATLISLTKYSRNPLAKSADICLYSSSSETLIRSGPMGSRIGQLAVIDVLYTAVASRQYEQVKSYLDKTRLATSKKHIQFNPE